MRNAGRGQRCDLSAGSSYKMKWGKRSNCSEEGIENSKAQLYQKSIAFPETTKEFTVLDLIVLYWKRQRRMKPEV